MTCADTHPGMVLQVGPKFMMWSLFCDKTVHHLCCSIDSLRPDYGRRKIGTNVIDSLFRNALT